MIKQIKQIRRLLRHKKVTQISQMTQIFRAKNGWWLFTNIDVYIDEDWRQINHWEPFSFHVNLRQFIRQPLARRKAIFVNKYNHRALNGSPISGPRPQDLNQI